MSGTNNDLNTEIWKWYPRYPAIEISNYGRIRCDGKIRSISDNGRGYKRITINFNGKTKGIYVHRAVMETFNPRYDSAEYEVHHKDNNPANNCLDNLQWMTRLENMRHAFASGRHSSHYRQHRIWMKGLSDQGKHWNSKLNKEIREEIYHKNRSGKSIRLLAKEYEVCEGTIERAIKLTKEAISKLT